MTTNQSDNPQQELVSMRRLLQKLRRFEVVLRSVISVLVASGVGLSYAIAVWKLGANQPELSEPVRIVTHTILNGALMLPIVFCYRPLTSLILSIATLPLERKEIQLIRDIRAYGDSPK